MLAARGDDDRHDHQTAGFLFTGQQVQPQKGLADSRRVAEELLETGTGDGRVGDPVVEALHHLRLGDDGRSASRTGPQAGRPRNTAR